MKIAVINMKGGVGKTACSQFLAQHPDIDANIITNDKYQALVKIYPDDVILAPNLKDIEEEIDELEDIVFDLGGFLDPYIISLIKICDYIIVPAKTDIDSLMASVETIQELLELGVKKKKLIVIDNMKEDDSVVKEAIVENFGEKIKVFNLNKTGVFDKVKSFEEPEYVVEYMKKNNKNKYVYRNLIKQIDTIVKHIKGG